MTRTKPPPPSRRDRRAAARLEPREPRARAARRAPQRPAWQSPIAIVSAVAVLVGVMVVLFGLPRDEPAGDLTIPPMPYSAELNNGLGLGSPDAPVVMDLYSDFQCPACRLFVTDRLPSLYGEFVATGILRIEAKDIVILDRGGSEESLNLAVGARCAAEQDRYWQFHDIAFWNQGGENRGDHDAAFIAGVADAAGVDRTEWDACLARGDAAPEVRSDTANALASGISSTPTLVVNGQRVVGVQPYAELAALIRSLVPAAGPEASPAP